MNIFKQIEHAWEEHETLAKRVELIYRIIIGLGVCVPLLFICGFICGCVMFKNPIEAGTATVDGMF